MGGAESVEVRITNLSDEIILYKYIYEKAYLEMQNSTKRAEIGVAGNSLGGGLTAAKTYKHSEAPEPGFSTLLPRHHHTLTLELAGSKIVYVTIQLKGGPVIWENLQQKKKRSIIITKDLQIKTDDNYPYKERPDDQQEPPALDPPGRQNYANITGGKDNTSNGCKTTEIKRPSGERSGLGRKPASTLSPRSGRTLSGLGNPQGQLRQQTLGGQMGQQQRFNKPEKGVFFGEDEEISSYVQPDDVPFNPGRDTLDHPNSPSQGFNAGDLDSQGKLENNCRLPYSNVGGFNGSISENFRPKVNNQ